MARPTEQAVTAFIALIDKWLMLQGVTYTIHQPDPPAALRETTNHSSPTEQDDIPIFVDQEPSLDDLLLDQEREAALIGSLSAQIDITCMDKELVQATSAQLLHEFTALSLPPAAVTEFASSHIKKQVAVLRKSADHINLPPAFEVMVVSTLEPNGKVDDITTIYPPKDVTWFNFKSSIRRATGSWQSLEAGFPSGYGIKEGEWLYQHAHKFIPAKPIYPLTTAQHFEEMCNTMEQTDTTVLIWHERIWKECQARQKWAAEVRDRRSEYAEDEPLNPDRTPYFEAEFDDYDWGEIDFSEEVEEHRRTYMMPELEGPGEDAMDEE